MAAHAKLSPSSAARWMTCTASVALAEKYPNKDSGFAAEGTVYHQLVSDGLEFGFAPSASLGKIIVEGEHEVEVTEEMVAHAEEAIDHIEDNIFKDGPRFVEERISLEPHMPGQFGTMDAGSYDDKTIFVHDEKYGAGVPVSPVENPQAMLYALGFYNRIKHKTPAKEIVISINQPRSKSGGGEWSLSTNELVEFGEEVKRVVREIEEAPKFEPSPKACFFCPARKACEAYAEFCLHLMDNEFEDLDAMTPPKLPDKITPKRRSYVLTHAAMIKSWLRDLEDSALADAIEDPSLTPGMKAVLGRAGPRRWGNTSDAEEGLRKLTSEEIFVKSLITPTAAEKLIGKKTFGKLANLVQRSEPKPTLVSAKDNRPAYTAKGVSFDNLDEDF